MRVYIAGIDGYLGWALALHLQASGHTVGGCDNGLRREMVREIGSVSAVPIASVFDRSSILKDRGGVPIDYVDMLDYDGLKFHLRWFDPDAIVHLGEIPAAPYSMIDVHHAKKVIENNELGTVNLIYAIKDVCRGDAHLVKLGSMGEYGTPNIDIPEGHFDIEYRGRKDRLPFPRQAGSWYHLTKVSDSQHLEFACKTWGLTATDIMQGVVFGLLTREIDGDNEDLFTRFDFDAAVGTVVNRYCAQAVIGHPLTPYGKGGQTRGFLPLRDSLQCMRLIIENPPKQGEYRVVNQFAETFSVRELAEMVARKSRELNISSPDICTDLDNPRTDMEEHYYNPDHLTLRDLGYDPTGNVAVEIMNTLYILDRYADVIRKHSGVLLPTIRWRD